MRLYLRCPVYPTEDATWVCTAITNILGPQSFTISLEGPLKIVLSEFLTLDSLERLRERAHELGVVNSAVTHFTSNWDGTTTTVLLDKQAAYVKRLRVVDESEESPPLGTIHLSMTFDDKTEFDNFLAWFAQRP